MDPRQHNQGQQRLSSAFTFEASGQAPLTSKRAIDALKGIGTTATTAGDGLSYNTNPDLAPSAVELGRMVTSAQPGSSLSSPSAPEIDFILRTPSPPPAFTHPPSPPRPELRRKLPSGSFAWLEESGATGAEKHPAFRHLYSTQLSNPAQDRVSLSTSGSHVTENEQPRRPLTSIAGSSRCLWPPDSTFLTMTSTFRERAFQHTRIEPEKTVSGRSSVGVTAAIEASQKNHSRSESYKDTGDCMYELQPRRKARRVTDGPYFNERNGRMVAGHVRKLIQEAVEDGVGELDLSNLELNDLPSDIRDLNFAIVYNERGSFSLSKNRLKLFLSSNQFSSIPMHVFSLSNLSVLSIRNNSIEVIPPEIGLLHNLVELSVGGNLLKVLPSQIALLPKLHILTIHPNPFLTPPEPEPEPEVGSDAIPHPPTEQGENNTGLQVLIPGQEGFLAQAEEGQHSMQHSFISPPASPYPGQIEDTDMISAPEQESIDPGSTSFSTTGSETFISDVMDTALFSAEPSSQELTPAASETEPIREQSVDSSVERNLPPYKVTRSRVPSLLVLAGNALLSHMEAQDTKAMQGSVDRPRKDSKALVEEEECSDHQAVTGETSEQQHYQSKGSHEVPQAKKRRYVCKEETIKSYMTPYLLDHYRRARTNNRCGGCQRRFWKPCRIVVVWQDLLGQTKVPIEWKGCGIGGCLGVPASVWPRNTPKTTASEMPAVGVLTAYSSSS